MLAYLSCPCAVPECVVPIGDGHQGIALFADVWTIPDQVKRDHIGPGSRTVPGRGKRSVAEPELVTGTSGLKPPAGLLGKFGGQVPRRSWNTPCGRCRAGHKGETPAAFRG